MSGQQLNTFLDYMRGAMETGDMEASKAIFNFYFPEYA
eukprot:gene432-1830_t